MKSKLLAEAIGTAFLLLSIVGSALMAANLFPDQPGLQLLANAGATGLALYVLIAIFAPISGAHFNPVVTASMVMERDLSTKEAVFYVLVQIVAAILGVMAAHFIFDSLPIEASGNIRSGVALWASEIVATFGLVLLILLARRQPPGAIPALVGCYIAGAYWFTASTSFANPAVTIGRIITSSPAGISASDAPGFIAMQIIGAALAYGAYKILASDR